MKFKRLGEHFSSLKQSQMKNKEIEELLQTLDGIASGDWIQMLPKEANLLLSYIEQLEKENKILRENAEHNDKVVDKVNWEINILKHNRDKAIDKLYCWGEVLNSEFQKEMLNILKGDSDD